MDFRDYPSNKSPRKELQGPRPAPLRVQKESHKIKKPPPVPPRQQQQQGLHRPPVIIYTVSPKVIHANPSEFMNLVQRLTGSSSSSSSSSSSTASTTSSNFQYNYPSSALSPAARFASIENTRPPDQGKMKLLPMVINENDVSVVVEGVEFSTQIERSSAPFHGILSPNPASLQPISSNFFSPTSDPNSLGFFYDMSPVLQSNKNYLDTSFSFPSPSTFISPRITSSPNAQSIDFFNHLFDL